MSRCGCAQQCPPCPQAVYLDMMPDSETPLALALTTAPTVRNLITRTFTVAAALPGFGFTTIAEFNACAGDDQNDVTISWALLLNGAVIQSRTKLNWSPDECESFAIIAGQQNLAPGTYTVVLQITAAMEATTGDITIFGGAMRTELVRSDNLVVTGGPGT